MRVLITGASGFVGGAVAAAALDAGHDVVGLVRDPARATRAAGADLRRGDMLEPTSYVPLVGEVDAVVHAAQLAVDGRLTRRRAERVFAADGVMTTALADACREQRKRFVYTAGCFDWGDRGEVWVDEDTPLDPSPMGIGHARQAAVLDAMTDLDAVRVAPGFVYGPGGLFKQAFVDQARAGRLRCLGRGTNWWSCVHVDDLATAYLGALTDAPPRSAYAVADEEPLRLRELTDLTAAACGVGPVGTLPPALGALFLGGTLTASLTTSFRIDPRRAREELGWRPRHPRFRDEVGEVVAATP